MILISCAYFKVVASGILYVVMHGNPEKNALCKVLDPLLKKLSPISWDVLHMNVMWNIKKPVWFQVSSPIHPISGSGYISGLQKKIKGEEM